MKTKWIITLLAVLLASACYHDEDIEGTLEEPAYRVEDSSDPMDHYIYNYNRNTGGFILYTYDIMDYCWNMSVVLPVKLTPQEDRSVLWEGLQVVDRLFLGCYDDAFKSRHFPFKLLLADSIRVEKTGTYLEDEVATAGRSFMAIGRMHAGVGEMTPDERREMKSGLHACFWAGFLFDNGRLALPDAFWSISGEYYGKNLKNEEENEDVPAPEIDVKRYGFWASDPDGPNPRFYCMAPDESLDLFHFVKTITSHTEEEMMELVAGYDLLRDKYFMLLDHIRQTYGIDLQAIGNETE